MPPYKTLVPMKELSQFLTEVEVFDLKKNFKTLNNEECKFGLNSIFQA